MTSELLIYVLPNRREYETTDHANLPPSQEPRPSPNAHMHSD